LVFSFIEKNKNIRNNLIDELTSMTCMSRSMILQRY